LRPDIREKTVQGRPAPLQYCLFMAGCVRIPDRLRMPFVFDAAAMARDIRHLPESLWERHFNADYYSGDWSGVALRSNGGRVSLYAQPDGSCEFADTPLLGECPNLAAALGAFACSLNSVRLLRLGPGASVREHRDYGLDWASGEARFHVPIVSESAEFVLDARPIAMRPGECWYVDVDRPHRVANSGRTARIHLVIDCIVDDWLKGIMIDAASRP
jgi:hypothetical protein